MISANKIFPTYLICVKIAVVLNKIIDLQNSCIRLTMVSNKERNMVETSNLCKQDSVILIQVHLRYGFRNVTSMLEILKRHWRLNSLDVKQITSITVNTFNK